MFKTPQFDTALDAIFTNLVPHERVCTECAKSFLIEAGDIELLKKLRVPPPTICSPCKRQRRLAFLNYTSLYKRKCNAPGHTEEMISSIPPGSPFSVYDYDYWNSYVWEPFSYGKEYVGGPFLAHFLGMLRRVPQIALTRHAGSVGSDYTLYGYNFKDCYFTFGGKKSEKVHYSNWPADSKDCLDMLICKNTELCSNSVFLYDSHKTNWAYFSTGCVESDFLYDCKNVQNCFGCVNLRNKQYCFFNEQLTKEEYERRRAEINLGNRDVLKKYTALFWEFVKKNPIRAVRIDRSENSTGNFLASCVDCIDVIRAGDSENVRHSDITMKVKDAMHVSVSANGEHLYETSGVATGSARMKFSYQSRTCFDSEFLANCRNVSNCFGCVGLENKQYCILNVQYTPEEYWKKVDEIKVAMLLAGEYGEFFPLSLSPYAYNGSLAQIVFPLEKEEVISRGAVWHDEELQQLGGLSAKPIGEVPADIKEVGDDILNIAIQGVEGKAFRVIKPELDFYRSQNLPIPEKHPYNRMVERFAVINNLRLDPGTCSSCGSELLAGYPKEAGYTLLCDACFNRQVV